MHADLRCLFDLLVATSIHHVSTQKSPGAPRLLASPARQGNDSVMHEQREEKDDGQRNANQPQKCAFPETHCRLLQALCRKVNSRSRLEFHSPLCSLFCVPIRGTEHGHALRTPGRCQLGSGTSAFVPLDARDVQEKRANSARGLKSIEVGPHDTFETCWRVFGHVDERVHWTFEIGCAVGELLS